MSSGTATIEPVLPKSVPQNTTHDLLAPLQLAAQLCSVIKFSSHAGFAGSGAPIAGASHTGILEITFFNSLPPSQDLFNWRFDA